MQESSPGSEGGKQDLKRRVDRMIGPTDLELALYWVNEMRHPCHDPRDPKMNLGMKWYTTAKEVLVTMQEKPTEEQNPFAIKILAEGIREFEENNQLNNQL